MFWLEYYSWTPIRKTHDQNPQQKTDYSCSLNFCSGRYLEKIKTHNPDSRERKYRTGKTKMNVVLQAFFYILIPLKVKGQHQNGNGTVQHKFQPGPAGTSFLWADNFFLCPDSEPTVVFEIPQEAQNVRYFRKGTQGNRLETPPEATDLRVFP